MSDKVQKVATSETAPKKKLPLPSQTAFTNSAMLSMKINKPLSYYFYIDSFKGNISIITDGDSQIIYKNDDEHSSPIVDKWMVDETFIVATENTIYFLSNKTKIET